jgi:C-terminal processing protease CtpA/Prc
MEQKKPVEGNLSVEEKLYGLSKLWMEAHYNFAFFSQVPELDWDDCYQRFIPQVLETDTDWEYYLVLQRFYALLSDGHTRVFPPGELRNTYYGTATKQIKTRLIEGKVSITKVVDDSLRSRGLEQGSEILAVDDLDVYDYAEKYVAPYACASTPHDRELQIYGHFLLSGCVSKPASVQVKGTDGKTGTFDIHREPWLMEEEVFQGTPMSFEELPNNIGYLRIHNFVDKEDFKPSFESVFSRILGTDGLIIDVRENFGGSTQMTSYVLQHFTDSPFQLADWKTPMHIAAHKAWGKGQQWHEVEGKIVEPLDGRATYTKPVNVIADESSFSGAEDFCAEFLTMKRGKLVGRKTAGSSGSPLMFDLPGGGLALVCTKKDVFPDGTEFIGFGIAPDVQVQASIKDVIEDRDAALEVAIRELSDE